MLNGNMTGDGTWQYAWTEENRLASVERPGTAGILPALRLTFTYDAQGRRRTKTVYTWDGQAWTLTRSHIFLYDRWNCIYEAVTDDTQNPAVTTAMTYVWGLDLSDGGHPRPYARRVASDAHLRD